MVNVVQLFEQMSKRHLYDGLNAAVQDGGTQLPDARVQLGHHHPHPLLPLALKLFHFDTSKSTCGKMHERAPTWAREWDATESTRKGITSMANFLPLPTVDEDFGEEVKTPKCVYTNSSCICHVLV